jgi:tRNA(Ile)-lysidine synthase
LDAVADDRHSLAIVKARPFARVAGAPIEDQEFSDLMTPLGPFERPPRLAVAVSGGADSMALALMAGAWVDRRGGRLLAITVDHGLRAESAAEAAQVGRWLTARGIAHETIPWTGAKPRSGIQHAARSARYALLFDCCRRHGIVHLLVGHHRDDQEETIAMRIDRGSGPDGLAAMPSSVSGSSARLLRPLLGVARARLEATLVARAQDWIEDPSNRNPAYARVRLRQRRSVEAIGAGDQAPLGDLARQMAGLRSERLSEAAATLARASTLMPEGYAVIDAAALTSASPEAGLRALDGLIRAVGGAAYPNPRDSLLRLWEELRAGLTERRSLGGCLIAPRRGGFLLMREPSAMQPPQPVHAGQSIRWDRRFDLRTAGSGDGRVGALTREGWAAIRTKIERPRLPAEVVVTLPALFDAAGLVAVPHLGWRREASILIESAVYAPTSLLAGRFWSD